MFKITLTYYRLETTITWMVGWVGNVGEHVGLLRELELVAARSKDLKC